LLARARADALGLTTHEVYVRDGDDGKVMEMHVEVPPGQTLGKAHEHVSQLEADIKLRLPEVEEVITHIEPAISQQSSADFAQQSEIANFRRQVNKLLNAHFPQADWHNIDISPTVSGFTLAMHVTLPAQISVEAAHQIAESAEVLLRAHMPLIERVTIHTEPPDETAH
jgi:divalent metal cation (Fe/Co/Zn/Cd) transporter